MEQENIDTILDPSVALTATPSVLQYVSNNPELVELKERIDKQSNLLHSKDLKLIQESLNTTKNEKLLSGQDLDKALEKMISNCDKFVETSQGPHLHELLAGSSLILPKNPVIPRNPVLAARIEKLKAQQSNLAYRAMTKDISSGKFRPEDSIAYQLNMMNRQLIAIGQVVLSVGAGFAFGFFGIPMAIGGMEFGYRVLLGLLIGVIIAVAELYFFIRYMEFEDSKEDNAKAKASHPHQD